MTNIILLPAKDYIKDLTQAIQNAKTRVYIMSLAISDDPLTHELIKTIKQTAGRGVKTNIAVDEFTFTEFGGYFNPLKRFKARSQAATKLAQEFKAACATFCWLGGGPKINPFAGVTHIKWALVDDIVYSFGGVNLYQEGIENTDYMLKLTNPELTDVLIKEQREIISADMSPVNYDGFYRPMQWGTVYIDSGERGNSVIYQRACELASQAHSIILVSQYCPSGPLAKILKAKKAKVYFNQPGLAGFYVRLFISFASVMNGIKSLYTRQNHLHAKFMLFEMCDGQKIALTGSHNFAYGGVNFGTREVALETTDKRVCQQLEDFFQKSVN